MPTTISPTGIANTALSHIGAQAISSLTDLTSRSAIECNKNFQLAYLSVVRDGQWNCLLETASLTNIPQVPLPGPYPVITATAWAPLTAYAANVYLSYGGYLYLTQFAYTSTASFVNDLTTGCLVQTDQTTGPATFGVNSGFIYASGWAFQYALPADFQLLGTVNENEVWDYDNSGGDEYEVMGGSLFCDTPTAVIKYVQSTPNTAKFDSMLTDAIAYKLASMIATPLRQDGGKLAAEMAGFYSVALRKARGRNAGERKPRRFNPIGSSVFVASRFGGVNG